MKIARVSLLLAFGAAAAIAAAPRTETMDFAPGGTIRIDRADGYMSIEAWDQARVEIITSETAKAQIKTSHPSASELVITTDLNHHPNLAKRVLHVGIHADADYVIRVPRNSHLVVTHANGYVGITGVAGDIEANNRRGDIVLMLPDLAKCDIDARTKVGLVTSDVNGRTSNHWITGETYASGKDQPRHLKLRMGFGGITIKEMPAEAIGPA
ncbi:MAG TPA: hypothetical protein VHA14_16915 [Bryobacteraceae bacterium]|nr:hypothetical protein [Bryobacteraceae bacterium]